MTLRELPTDTAALQEMVLQQFQRAEQECQRAELYKHRYELLTRRYFGQSSEKQKEAGQQFLFELPSEPEVPAPVATKEAPPAKKHGGGRKPLPPNLQRHRIEYTLPEDQRHCECCGEVMQPFGEEVTEQREFVPASLFVIQHAQIKYACKQCQEKPVTAPGPQKVIERISAGPGLLAWNVIAKFEHHQPCYRQEDIFKLHGDEIARSTQCSWLATVADLLAPLYRHMVANVLQSRKIHTDDTPIRVLEPGRGKTRTARFWVYLGDNDHPFTVFDYTTSRNRDGPEKFLKTFKGYLQADAYAGYDRLCAGKDVIEVACWAHARRKFFDAQDTDARASEMLRLIGEIYAIEEQGRGLDPNLRQQLRQQFTLPVLARIRDWLDTRANDALPKSPLSQAITYMLNQWTALTRFVDDGILEADNNLAENALRPICLGRKNYRTHSWARKGYVSKSDMPIHFACRMLRMKTKGACGNWRSGTADWRKPIASRRRGSRNWSARSRSCSGPLRIHRSGRPATSSNLRGKSVQADGRSVGNPDTRCTNASPSAKKTLIDGFPIV